MDIFGIERATNDDVDRKSPASSDVVASSIYHKKAAPQYLLDDDESATCVNFNASEIKISSAR